MIRTAQLAGRFHFISRTSYLKPVALTLAVLAQLIAANVVWVKPPLRFEAP